MTHRILRHVPNALSLTRLGLAAAFPWLPAYLWLPVAVIAMLTEYLDGALARRFDAVTLFGTQIDPVADKLFVVAVLGTLLVRGLLSPLALFLCVLRDLTVLSGIVWTVIHGNWRRFATMQPTLTGKVATAMQFGFILSVLAWQRSEPMLLYLTGAMSAVAAVDYIVVFTRGSWRRRRGRKDSRGKAAGLTQAVRGAS